MDIKYFHELAAYNVWANARLTNYFKEISLEQWNNIQSSSFPSIGATVLHIAGAELAWASRIEKKVQIQWLPNFVDSNDRDLVLSHFEDNSNHLASVVQSLTDENLNEALNFVRLNGEATTMQLSWVLAHIFNHSTYHRGQLITMLRNVGFTSVETVDFLHYARIFLS